jgi:hypothetical protein
MLRIGYDHKPKRARNASERATLCRLEVQGRTCRFEA